MFSITVHNIYMKTSTIVIIFNVGENKWKINNGLIGAGRIGKLHGDNLNILSPRQ